MASKKAGGISDQRKIGVAELLLDSSNPRLPDEVRAGTQAEVLDYLHEAGALDELAQSLIDSGYFSHEPLIVMKRKGSKKHTVIEGNRRLATLKILLGDPDSEDLNFDTLPGSDGDLSRLKSVPCIEVKSEEEVHQYLGFRHIGGLKPWNPPAKARYVHIEVLRVVDRGSEDPFYEIARRVGSNTQGIRNSFVAFAILQHAQSEFGVDVKRILSHAERRFGVWMRLLNSPEAREYMGFGTAKSYSDVLDSLQSLKEDELRQVVDDLLPRGKGVRAIVYDSRQATTYGRVLANKRARAVLRKHKSLELAAQIIRDESLPDQINELRQRCEVIRSELDRVEITDDIREATQELFIEVRGMTRQAGLALE